MRRLLVLLLVLCSSGTASVAGEDEAPRRIGLVQVQGDGPCRIPRARLEALGVRDPFRVELRRDGRLVHLYTHEEVPVDADHLGVAEPHGARPLLVDVDRGPPGDRRHALDGGRLAGARSLPHAWSRRGLGLVAHHDRRRRRATYAKATTGWGDWEVARRAEAEETTEALDWLTTAMSALPEDLRDTLALVLDDMTHAQAAEVLDVSEGTISWRISEAKKRLRELKEQVA